MKIFDKWIVVIVVILAFVGLYYRIQGISTAHSFWADEAYISSIARDLSRGEITITDLPSIGGARYQILHVLQTATMFTFFGASETSARIPSVFFSSIAIILAYYIAKGFSNKIGGLIAAFLMTIGYVQLVYATQARPYAGLTAFLFGIIYCLQQIASQKKQVWRLHVLLIALITITSFLHGTGIFYWAIYITFLLVQSRKNLINIAKRYPFIPIMTLISGVIVIYVMDLYHLPTTWEGKRINNVIYFVQLFGREYFFIALPAFFGFIMSYKKYPALIIGIASWAAPFLFAWNFIHYSHNVRYLVPFIGILFVFFGIFWGLITTKYFKKKELLIGLSVIAILYVSGYKLARIPSVYYNPNRDLYGDVQNANHKELYRQLREKYPNIGELTIFNDIADSQKWYLPEKPYPDVYFMRTANENRYNEAGNMILSNNLKDFLALQEVYPKGILIVEDWHSILPEDIKAYAKENMKREIRVEGLPQANGDNWPLEVYSWGL